MLTEIYIEALLVDEEAADEVWEAWDKGEIDDVTAYWAWLIVACRPLAILDAKYPRMSGLGEQQT